MILPLQCETSLEQSGGKAANLARLVRAGFRVPPSFIITTQAYRDHVSQHNLEHWLLEAARAARIDDAAALEATSAAIRARFAFLIGVALAMASTRLLRSTLYEVSPLEPRVFIGTVVLLLVAAAAACLVPALRATRADPMEALRAE